jgi:hypothetical protein
MAFINDLKIYNNIMNFQQFSFSLMIKVFPLTLSNFGKYFAHSTLGVYIYLLSYMLQIYDGQSYLKQDRTDHGLYGTLVYSC